MALADTARANLDRIRQAFTRFSVKQRWIFGVIGATIFSAVFTLVFLTSGDAGMVPLQSPVKDLQAARSELQKYTIHCEFSSDKNDLLVERSRRDRALLILNAARLLPDGLPNYAFLGETDFTSTEPQRYERIRVNIEDLLRQTIMAMDGIGQASVRITPASREVLFKPDANRNKASVTIGLVGQARLGNEQVLSIARLVSASYPNLVPEDVFIADTAGHPYTFRSDVALSADKYELRRRIEADKEEKAARALLGLDAVVAASIEVSMVDELSSRDLTYQPRGNEPVTGYRETATERETASDPRGTAGIRAEAQNTNRTDAASGSKSTVRDRKENIERMMVDESFRGELEKMHLRINYAQSSMAISLPQSAAEDEAAQASLRSRIVKLVSTATGLPGERIAVEFTPRLAPSAMPTDWAHLLLGEGGIIERYGHWAGYAMMLMMMLAALFTVQGVLRKSGGDATTPAPASDSETPELSEGGPLASNQIYEKVTRLAEENPAAAANLVRRWLLFNE